MSLLDKFNTTVTVFPQIETEDADGNIITKPSDSCQLFTLKVRNTAGYLVELSFCT